MPLIQDASEDHIRGKLVFIVNPVAGNGRGARVWEALEEHLRQSLHASGIAYDVFHTTRPREATQLAAELAIRRPLAIIAVGGDGTVHEIAAGLAEDRLPCPVGYIPAGSGNDFARSHQLPLDPVEALDHLLAKLASATAAAAAFGDSGFRSSDVLSAAAGAFQGGDSRSSDIPSAAAGAFGGGDSRSSDIPSAAAGAFEGGDSRSSDIPSAAAGAFEGGDSRSSDIPSAAAETHHPQHGDRDSRASDVPSATAEAFEGGDSRSSDIPSAAAETHRPQHGDRDSRAIDVLSAAAGAFEGGDSRSSDIPSAAAESHHPQHGDRDSHASDMPSAAAGAFEGGDSRSSDIPSAAAETPASGGTRPIDMLYGHAGWAVSSMGIGMDGLIAKMTNQSRYKRWLNRFRLGFLAYPLTLVRALITYRPTQVTVTIDGEELRFNSVWLIAVTNIDQYGGGMRITPDAIPDDGYADICIVSGISRLGLLLAFPRVYRGTHRNMKAAHFYRCREVKIAASKPLTIHADGEYAGETPITIEVAAGILNIIA